MKFRPWCTRAALVSAAFLAVAPAAAQLNVEIMQKWGAVTVIHYVVVGVYGADTLIVNAGTNGYAGVKDRVELAFDWDQTQAKLVGEPVIRNFPAETGTIRNGAAGCRAPTLNGKYDHLTLLSVAEGLGGQLMMSARRDFPAAAMPVACTGGSQAVPAKSVTSTEEFVVPGTMIFAMPSQAGAAQTVSADGNSIVFVNKGWTWTYTLTPVR
jgi:hypothetical protein